MNICMLLHSVCSTANWIVDDVACSEITKGLIIIQSLKVSHSVGEFMNKIRVTLCYDCRRSISLPTSALFSLR